VLAVAAAVIGVSGLGVGSAYGFIAMSKRDDASKACPLDPCSDSAGASKWSDAKSAGNVSTVAFVVGGVGVAAATVLWLTAPSAGQSTRVGLGPGTIQIAGSW
jgi:hypothetical protein